MDDRKANNEGDDELPRRMWRLDRQGGRERPADGRVGCCFVWRAGPGVIKRAGAFVICAGAERPEV